MTSRHYPNEVRREVRVIIYFPSLVNASSVSYGAGAWMSEFPGFHLTTPTAQIPLDIRIMNFNEYHFKIIISLSVLLNLIKLFFLLNHMQTYMDFGLNLFFFF